MSSSWLHHRRSSVSFRHTGVISTSTVLVLASTSFSCFLVGFSPFWFFWVLVGFALKLVLASTSTALVLMTPVTLKLPLVRDALAMMLPCLCHDDVLTMTPC